MFHIRTILEAHFNVFLSEQEYAKFRAQIAGSDDEIDYHTFMRLFAADEETEEQPAWLTSTHKYDVLITMRARYLAHPIMVVTC